MSIVAEPLGGRVVRTPERGKVPVVFWRALKHLGLRPSAVLRQARLPATLHLSKQSALTTAQRFALWRAVEELTGDPGFGLKMVEATAAVGHKPSFIAACHAASYREALARIARFARLSALEELHFEERAGEFLIWKEWPHSIEAESPILVDMTFGFLLDLGRRGTGKRLTPVRLEFARSGVNMDAHQDHFGCPIRCGARRDLMVLRGDDIDRPFPGHNPELLELLTPALLATLSDFDPDSTVADQAKVVLKRGMADGRPELSEVARELGMSERTLQRRITEEGTTFRTLVADARRELGQQLLLDPTLRIDEVACLLGFQDTNSFYRAFKQNEGVTPGDWQSRERRQAGGRGPRP